MEPLISGEDYAILKEGIRETGTLTDRQVAIKSNAGFVGGTYDGTAPSPVYKYFYLQGTVERVTQNEITNSGGELVFGDITLETLIDIRQKGEGGGGYTLQEGDVLVYDGYEYFIWGSPNREFLAGGMAFSRSYWKRK